MGKGIRRASLSAQDTTQGTQKGAWICAEPLRPKLGALGLWQCLCSHMGAPESLSDGAETDPAGPALTHIP